MPTYGHGRRGKAVLGVGFKLYDLLTADRNRHIADPARRIPSTRFLTRRQTLRRFPDLEEEGLTGGAVFFDGQMHNPPRLALSFLRAAAEDGAYAANYMEVTDILREGDRVVGVRAQDLLSDRTLEVRARLVLNATGPWASRLLEDSLNLDLGGSRPTFSRDVGLVTTRRPENGLGLACSTGSRDADALVDRGGRHLFLLPWRGYTLVGVWHGVYSGDPDVVRVSRKELRSFVRDANHAYPGLDLSLDQVTMVNTGLILFGDDAENAEGHQFGHESIVIDHTRRHDLDGLITLIGVRATMARGTAADVIDLALRKLGRPHVPSRTEAAPVYGGEIANVEAHMDEVKSRTSGLLPGSAAGALARNYGSRYDDVLSYASDDARLGETLGGSTVLRAEVLHAVDREMAARLSDVVLRRTDLGTARHPGRETLESCAELMGERLGWSDGRQRAEVNDLERFLASRGATRRYREPAPPHPGATSVG